MGSLTSKCCPMYMSKSNKYDKNKEYLCSIRIIGECGVGKSALLFQEQPFNESYSSTIGVEFVVNRIEINNMNIKMQLWELSGNERYRQIISSYFTKNCGIVLIYDITNRESFNMLPYWIDLCKTKNKNSVVPMVLVGNKCDLHNDRVISEEEGMDFAKEHNIPFIEASAKNNINIDKI
jgi:small GTP-binding protein